MRFDDGLHIAPASDVVDGDGFGREAWQTKVDQKRKEIIIAVLEATLSDRWLHEGFRCWFAVAPETYMRGKTSPDTDLPKIQWSIPVKCPQ